MKTIKVYEVEKIEGIDLTRYTTGTEFHTTDNIYKLHHGELKPLLPKKPKTKKKAGE